VLRETLRAQGKTVILITHKLREIMAITDCRLGHAPGRDGRNRQDRRDQPEQLAELMVGRRVLLRVEKGPAKPGKTMLEVENLVVEDDMGVVRVKDVSFTVRAGEIVGIAGVSGERPVRTARIHHRHARPEVGTVILNGNPLSLEGDDGAAIAPASPASPTCPRTASAWASSPAFEEWENAMLGYQDDPPSAPGHARRRRGVQASCRERIKKFDVRPADERLKTAQLLRRQPAEDRARPRDGARDPDVLVVGQPTRGVDIGAIEFIHNQIIRMRDAGKAVLLVSVELDEIRSLATASS
jgi:ABC-type uncharacterized transport system ATPase subunit